MSDGCLHLLFVNKNVQEKEQICEVQWRTEGGLECSNPPPEILKALQNCATLKPICENC